MSGAQDDMDAAFLRQIEGFSLTTAEILYRLPDHPKLLQTYIWQDYDLAPRFPNLIKFLDFWSHNLDGPLATIQVAQAGLVAPARLSLTSLKQMPTASTRRSSSRGPGFGTGTETGRPLLPRDSKPAPVRGQARMVAGTG